MSIGFRALARSVASYDELIAAIKETVDDAELSRYMSLAIQPDGLCCKLHPAEEPLQFTIDENERMTVLARTAGAGPGYHSFLLSLVDNVGTALELDWVFEDDTEFALHFSFEKLQRYFAQWLHNVAKRMLSEAKDEYHYSLSLPLGFQVVGDHFCATPKGFVNKDWFKKYLAENDKLAMAQEFFPWWNEGRDGSFYHSLGSCLLWTDVLWHFPVNEEDARIPTLALDCFKRAQELAPHLSQPKEELRELKRLLASTSQLELPPKEEGIGYRRHILRELVAGGWRIDIPGFFHFETENEGSTEIFWHGGRTIRLTTLTVHGKDNEKLSPERVLSKLKVEESVGDSELNRHDQGFIGRATLERHEEDGDEYWSLTCQAAATSSYCLLTICYDDESDLQWAKDTWLSLAFQGED